MVHRVTNAIATLSSQEIVFPDDTSETNKWFLEYCGLPAISGVVDGSHIPIQSPGGTDAELFRCRKTFFSFNTQFVCDERLRIIDVVSGWPGSTHDSRIWNNSKPSLEITWFSCPDRTLKIMSQIKFDFLNQLIARSAISLKIKYESQIKSLRKS